MNRTTLEVTPQITELVVNPGTDQTVLEVQQTTVQILTIGIQGPAGVDGGGLAAVEDDPAPALGGDLTLGVHNIIGQLENTNFVLDGGLL